MILLGLTDRQANILIEFIDDYKYLTDGDIDLEIISDALKEKLNADE